MALAKWFSKGEAKLPLNPGEFEVLKTTAQQDWWQNGTLLITNHRLFWTNSSAPEHPMLEVDLRDVLGCVEVRSWYYLLLKPALRVLLKTGKSVEFHAIRDFAAAKNNIERLMGQERYTPGALFGSS